MHSLREERCGQFRMADDTLVVEFLRNQAYTTRGVIQPRINAPVFALAPNGGAHGLRRGVGPGRYP
jgi:hypothetical protein